MLNIVTLMRRSNRVMARNEKSIIKLQDKNHNSLILNRNNLKYELLQKKKVTQIKIIFLKMNR